MVEHLPPPPSTAEKMVKATKKMASSTKVKMASLREALAEKFASEEKEDDQGVIPIEEPSTDEENSESQKAEQEQEQEPDEPEDVEQNEEEISEEEEELPSLPELFFSELPSLAPCP